MTPSAIKRAERRAENADLKARGICIDCYAEHATGAMRCEPCAVTNRGGALRVRGRKRVTDPAARLGAALAVNSREMSGPDRQRIYNARSYWRRRVNEMNRGER